MTKRLAVIGMGKMGHAIAELAPSRGWEIAARLDEADVKQGITRESLNGADVAVELTVPDAAPSNVRALIDAACPVVVGTTGWYEHYDGIKQLVTERDGALLTATNFSLCVN